MSDVAMTYFSMRRQLQGSNAQCLEPTRERILHALRNTKGTVTRSQVYVTLCLYTTGSWETHKQICPRHQIIVRTRGRCVCRAHEFSSASGHSTHCWAYTQCTGNTNSLVMTRFMWESNASTSPCNQQRFNQSSGTCPNV